MEDINVITILAIVILIITIVSIYFETKKNNVEKISFKEALDLTDLPIITFMQGNNKYNFLLDTGSTDSHINKSLVDNKKIEFEKTNYVNTVFGMEGNAVEVNIVSINLFLKKNSYNDNFFVNDLSNAFDNIKRENGVTLHGILGSKFFEKYKYVLDFSQNVAYSKK